MLLLINTLKFEHGEDFTFNDSNFLLLLSTADDIVESDQASDAEYYESTQIEGWDLYLLDSLSGEDRKRKLFHEILECNLRDQGLSVDEAHDLVKREEQKIFGERKR